MTPDDVVRLLALACPPTMTAEDATITQAEVAQLLDLAISMRPQLLALAAAAGDGPRRQMSADDVIQLRHNRERTGPRAVLATPPVAPLGTTPRSGPTVLPMASSHTYWDKPGSDPRAVLATHPTAPLKV